MSWESEDRSQKSEGKKIPACPIDKGKMRDELGKESEDRSQKTEAVNLFIC
ncbi:MAG TPA: hypothetical protein VKA34_12540 [Balneolales bacterium]|nr:hypothetical protein [Balneolales bacterium]